MFPFNLILVFFVVVVVALNFGSCCCTKSNERIEAANQQCLFGSITKTRLHLSESGVLFSVYVPVFTIILRNENRSQAQQDLPCKHQDLNFRAPEA